MKNNTSNWTEQIMTEEDWKSKFPSHDVLNLDKVYNKFNLLQKEMRSSKEEKVVNASKSMTKALKTFVSLRAQLKEAETFLYRK